MAESDVFDEEKLFATFLQRGKAFGLQETELMDYVDKQIRQAQERQDRLIVRREEETNRKQLELAAIKEREETARQTAKEQEETARQTAQEQEETARQKEQEETKRQVQKTKEEEETKRQAQAHSQPSTQQDGGEGLGQASRVGHRPTLPKLPAFRDKTDDIDSYLFRFETHATALKWDKTHWVTYLSALLEGTALTLFHSLSDTEDGTVTYEQLKSALLKKFQCTPEGFRKRFRESKPTAGEPFETYAVELRRLADRWISLSKVEKTYEGLLGLILSEQLLQSVSHDLATFLCEKDERSFQNLIKSAESYRHAHPNKNLARRSEATVFGSVASVRDEHRPSEHFGPTNSFRGHGGYQSGPSRFWNRRGFDSTRRSWGDGRFRGQATRKEMVDTGRSGNQSSTTKCCFLCKQPGHFHQACPWKSRKNPCRICNFSHPPDQCPFHKAVTKESMACALAPPSVHPEVDCSLQESFSGKLHLQSGTVNGVRCSVLRDTGATICAVRKRLVQPCQLLGSSIRCVSFGGREEEFPLAKVSVESPYFSGEMTCCVLDAPVADFIVGNVPQVPSLVSQDESCELTMQNSSAASQRNKNYYDKKTQDRKFSVGEEVLVLLPSASNKLLSSWLGPFPITKVFHPDYRVLVKGKEKVFHANMLKRYVRREEAADVAVGGSKCVQSVGDFVPWREISLLLDGVGMSVPKVPSTSSGNFHAVESVCSAGVVQDHGEDVSIPTLSVPMSTSIPDEDVSCVQFDAALSEVQLDELKAVFQAHADILTTRPGVFSGNLMLEIPLTSDVPIRRKMYNLPFSSKEVVEKEIQVMLDLEIIEPSKSPYSSPVVLVRKKDGSCRFCIDFRGLNKITVFDAEPIPNVEDLFVRLAHSRFFTKTDLAKGYWQILVLPEDRPKTAFATHQGLFQFIRMPFGLVSAPTVFARMMRMLHLADLSAENFFDDILVHSASWSDHLHHVRNVLDRLKSYGLTARPSKILAGFQSLEFLGHVVGSGVLRPDESKTEKILQVSTPTTKKQVRSLLGLLSFYRRYIPGFASVAAPLTDLTKESGRSCRSIHWTPDCACALQEIQDILSRKPVLLLPRLDLPFVLQTDASSTGLGAVLLQEFEDSLHPVCSASRKLLDREKRYSTIERECLAIVWAVHKFVRFLWGVRFVLQTDHRPLTYLRTSNFKNSRIMRWALSLQEFSFEVLPVSGQANVFADLLSRSAVDQVIPWLVIWFFVLAKRQCGHCLFFRRRG